MASLKVTTMLPSSGNSVALFAGLNVRHDWSSFIGSREEGVEDTGDTQAGAIFNLIDVDLVG